MTKSGNSLPSFTHSAQCSNAENTFDNGMNVISRAIRDLITDDTDATKTIQQAEAMLNDLDEARANLLAIRAQALRKQGEVDKAIADASKAINAWPTSGKFYQLTGDLYIAHGKPKLAIEILEDGLRSLPPSEWPSLYDKRETATRALNAKVNFVSVLPLEITARIFEWERDMETASDEFFFPSLWVSKAWRTTILGCSNLWKVAKYYEDGDVVFQHLPSVSSHVKELDIDGIPKQVAKKLMMLATCGKLQNVAKIALSRFDDAHIMFSLTSAVGKQLTELKIDFTEDSNHKLALNVILETCSNMKALTVLSVDRSIEYQQSQLPSGDTVNLEMLSIWAPNDKGDFLRQLIPRCRQLRFLNIARYPRDVIELVTKHCLQLEEISIIDTEDEAFDCIWMKEYKKQRHPTTGLKKLQYSSKWRDDNPPDFIPPDFIPPDVQDLTWLGLRDFTPLWIKWKNTLQELDLEMREHEDFAEWHWDSLISGPYTQLKSLRLHFLDEAGSQFVNQVSKMLQLCPALEHISLAIQDALPNDFFTVLLELPSLRQLNIRHLDKSSGGLQQYFEYLSTHEQKCNLKEITIGPSEAITEQILFTLAGIHSLENIIIHGSFHLVSASGIAMLLQKLKSNVGLQYLELKDMEYFTDDCLPALDELVELNGNGDKYYLGKYKANSNVDRFRSHYNIEFSRTT